MFDLAVSSSRLYSDGALLVGSCPLTGCMWLQMTSFIGRFKQSPNPKYSYDAPTQAKEQL